MSEEVYIISGSRTPMGALDGSLGSQNAAQLGAVAIAGALKRGGVNADQIDEVYMGCVLAAGQGQAPARQAALGAGLAKACLAPLLTRCAARACKPLLWALTLSRQGRLTSCCVVVWKA